MMRIRCSNGEALAKRLVFIAWQACGGPHRLGALQDRGSEHEEAIWLAAYEQSDYATEHGDSTSRRVSCDLGPTEALCDYVRGRKLKFKIGYGPNWAEISVFGTRSGRPHRSKQDWSIRYPTIKSLVAAALTSLSAPNN